jgi:hypothetical protein
MIAELEYCDFILYTYLFFFCFIFILHIGTIGVFCVLTLLYAYFVFIGVIPLISINKK